VIERLGRFLRPVPPEELPELPRAITRAIRIASLILVTVGPAISTVQIVWGDFTLERVVPMVAIAQPLVWACFAATYTTFGRRHPELVLLALVTITNLFTRFAGVQGESGANPLSLLAVISPLTIAAFAPWRPVFSLATGASVAIVYVAAAMLVTGDEEIGAPLAVALSFASAIVAASACQSQRLVWADLHRARRDAQAAAQAKSEFLATMSHEIRTPMTAILGFTDELLGNATRGSSAPAPGPALLTIKRNGEHLLRIIDDILDVAKLDAGKLEPTREACSPRELVAGVTELLRASASEKRLELIVDLADTVPLAIHSDPMRLRQILLNLVGNAIKFTERGEVRIQIRPGEARAGEPPLLVFEISDTGIGLSAEQKERLFEPFSQADASMARRFGGTGLGLAISRRLARMLGGDIAIESVPQRGSVFRLSIAIPAAPPAVSAAQLRPDSDDSRQVLRGRVLLAEDGPDNRALLQRILVRAGLEVEVAGNGREAHAMAMRALFAGTPFDVVLMDMQMPEMTGDEAVRALRADGYSGPIVALTAQALSGDREACLAAGCDDYATKPIDRAALLGLLARLLEKSET